jgi:RNA polymerase sigma-70 factor (ECF subfamily)
MEPDGERAQRFEQLFLSHEAAVRAYARRRAPMTVDDDVVSDSILVAWRRVENLDADPLPWLLATARRLLANPFRAERSRGALVSRLSRLGPGPDHFEPAASMNPRLADALRQLPAREREASLLLAWEELDISRAARVAGCSSATFRVRLHRSTRMGSWRPPRGRSPAA